MFNDIKNVQKDLQLHIMGKGHLAGQQDNAEPTGDKVINAFRAAIWEAWEKGLDSRGQSIYPTLPLLDGEPDEPEI
jgi:hypothetical protein